MKIKNLFTSGKKLFIPYMTAGVTGLAESKVILQGLAAAGADIIELGVPFSDPIADGGINQEAAYRALENHVTLRDCCQIVKELREENFSLPVILFTYLNPIFVYGYKAFAQLAKDSGIDAVLIVDMPVEEADELLVSLRKQAIETVFLVAPTTSRSRMLASAQASSAFLYYISRCGVTGSSNVIYENMQSDIAYIKKHINIPVATGFGIATPEDAGMIAQITDGVIIGSALVKILQTKSPNVLSDLFSLATEFNNAIKQFSSKEFL